jgi:hypothetical protein
MSDWSRANDETAIASTANVMPGRARREGDNVGAPSTGCRTQPPAGVYGPSE